MIKSFKDEETENLFERRRNGWSREVKNVGRRKLLMIDAAITLADLRIPPGNRLEKLKGDRKGQYSIRINDQWRVCFNWRSGAAYSVEITDYH